MEKPKTIVKIPVTFIKSIAKKIQVEVTPLLQFENLTDLRVRLRPAGGAARVDLVVTCSITIVALIIIAAVLMLLL